MAFDGRAVANYVLDGCSEVGQPITNLALQKIVYFCHAWCLVHLQKPLIRHDFEAWQHGPVLQYLYHDFSKHGSDPITSRATKIDAVTGKRVVVPYAFEPELERMLDEVVRFYGRRSASELVRLSHVVDGPWFNVWFHNSNLNPGMKIKNADIEKFYSSRASVAQ